MKFRVVIEFDLVVNRFSVICPALFGCASAGDPEEEARLNLVPTALSLRGEAKLLEVVIG